MSSVDETWPDLGRAPPTGGGGGGGGGVYGVHSSPLAPRKDTGKLVNRPVEDRLQQ